MMHSHSISDLNRSIHGTATDELGTWGMNGSQRLELCNSCLLFHASFQMTPTLLLRVREASTAGAPTLEPLKPELKPQKPSASAIAATKRGARLWRAVASPGVLKASQAGCTGVLTVRKSRPKT